MEITTKELRIHPGKILDHVLNGDDVTVRNEFRSFQKQMRTWKTEIIHIDSEISARAMFYVQEYSLSHVMWLSMNPASREARSTFSQYLSM